MIRLLKNVENVVCAFESQLVKVNQALKETVLALQTESFVRTSLIRLEYMVSMRRSPNLELKDAHKLRLHIVHVDLVDD
jgi:hypothetical protein